MGIFSSHFAMNDANNIIIIKTGGSPPPKKQSLVPFPRFGICKTWLLISCYSLPTIPHCIRPAAANPLPSSTITTAGRKRATTAQLSHTIEEHTY